MAKTPRTESWAAYRGLVELQEQQPDLVNMELLRRLSRLALARPLAARCLGALAVVVDPNAVISLPAEDMASSVAPVPGDATDQADGGAAAPLSGPFAFVLRELADLTVGVDPDLAAAAVRALFAVHDKAVRGDAAVELAVALASSGNNDGFLAELLLPYSKAPTGVVDEAGISGAEHPESAGLDAGLMDVELWCEPIGAAHGAWVRRLAAVLTQHERAPRILAPCTEVCLLSTRFSELALPILVSGLLVPRDTEDAADVQLSLSQSPPVRARRRLWPRRGGTLAPS